MQSLQNLDADVFHDDAFIAILIIEWMILKVLQQESDDHVIGLADVQDILRMEHWTLFFAIFGFLFFHQVNHTFANHFDERAIDSPFPANTGSSPLIVVTAARKDFDCPLVRVDGCVRCLTE